MNTGGFKGPNMLKNTLSRIKLSALYHFQWPFGAFGTPVENCETINIYN